jgi:hypothetical protein
MARPLQEGAVIARSPETFAGLCADGCDAIVFACAGGFSAMDGDEGIQKPMHDALMPPAIVATGRVLCEKPD